jgi:hypothetical protein
MRKGQMCAEIRYDQLYSIQAFSGVSNEEEAGVIETVGVHCDGKDQG